MTNTKTVTRDPTEPPPKPKTNRWDLSGTQLIGGALAAMTAAVIGAQLGVAGTVLGAAIGSIVAGTAGSLYTASLKHTHNKITTAFVGRIKNTPIQVTTQASTADDTAADASTTVDGWPAIPQPMAAVAPPTADPVATATTVDPTGRSTTRWRWQPILVSTAALFLLAIAGITVFELASGHAVSGGEGTTITQVSQGRSGGPDGPGQVPSSDTSTEPTTEPSEHPSTEPSNTPFNAPTPTTEPTTEPSSSTEPSGSTEPSTSSEATDTATPPTAGGEDGAAAGDSDAGG